MKQDDGTEYHVSCMSGSAISAVAVQGLYLNIKMTTYLFPEK